MEALRQLPQLTVSLGIHSYYGTEATAVPSEYPEADFFDLTELPPMAGLRLTQLRLLGEVSLPPDLNQLERLCSLQLYSLVNSAEWFAQQWVPLANLSRLEIIDTALPGSLRSTCWTAMSHAHKAALPWPCLNGLLCPVCVADAAMLAAAPRLAEVHAPGSPAEWRTQLAALRPDVRITPAPPPAAAP